MRIPLGKITLLQRECSMPRNYLMFIMFIATNVPNQRCWARRRSDVLYCGRQWYLLPVGGFQFDGPYHLCAEDPIVFCQFDTHWSRIADIFIMKNFQERLNLSERRYCLLNAFFYRRHTNLTVLKLSKTDWKEVSTNQVVFKTIIGRHFQCVSEQSIGMYLPDSSKKETDASLKMTNTKIEAFMESEKPEFSKQKTICSADESPDNTVPIAVGVALAICIVVALVVFVIFNRRNRRMYGTV
ncbi:uncharacterized protein DEA37_0003904 [Paragonimus westermani]|uniref:Uncharacterized protein n=1 Tax=Paragonimus westermani TaxID=34504 RepID=A0A5J4NIW0_9TREM|nr:uncharacterized protein DEA37_0003904 [Paragonimus westermani]